MGEPIDPITPPSPQPPEECPGINTIQMSIAEWSEDICHGQIEDPCVVVNSNNFGLWPTYTDCWTCIVAWYMWDYCTCVYDPETDMSTVIGWWHFVGCSSDPGQPPDLQDEVSAAASQIANQMNFMPARTVGNAHRGNVDNGKFERQGDGTSTSKVIRLSNWSDGTSFLVRYNPLELPARE